MSKEIVVLGGTFLFQVATFILGIVKIKYLTSIMNIEDFGYFNIYFPTLNLLFTIVVFGSDRYIVRYAHDKLIAFKILKTYYCYLITVCIVTSLFVYKYIPFYWVLVFSFLILSIAQVNRFYLFANQKIQEYNIVSFLINNHWITLLLIFPLWHHIPLDIALLIAIIGLVISMLTSFRYISEWRQTLHESIDIHVIQNGFKYSMPLLSYVLGQSLMKVVDKYVIIYQLGSEILGLYSIIVSIVFIATTSITVLLEVYRPSIFRINSANISELKEIVRKMIFISFWLNMSFIIGTIAFGKNIIILMANQEYLKFAYILPYLAIQSILICMTTICVYLCEKDLKNRLIGVLYLAACIVYSISSFMMCLYFGVLGIVVTSVIINLLLAVVLGYQSKIYKYFNYRDFKQVVVSTLLLLVSCLSITYLINNIYIQLIFAVLSFIIISFLFVKNTIKDLYSEKIKKYRKT